MNIPGVANGISEIAGEMVLPDGTRKVLTRDRRVLTDLTRGPEEGISAADRAGYGARLAQGNSPMIEPLTGNPGAMPDASEVTPAAYYRDRSPEYAPKLGAGVSAVATPPEPTMTITHTIPGEGGQVTKITHNAPLAGVSQLLSPSWQRFYAGMVQQGGVNNAGGRNAAEALKDDWAKRREIAAGERADYALEHPAPVASAFKQPTDVKPGNMVWNPEKVNPATGKMGAYEQVGTPAEKEGISYPNEEDQGPVVNWNGVIMARKYHKGGLHYEPHPPGSPSMDIDIGEGRKMKIGGSGYDVSTLPVYRPAGGAAEAGAAPAGAPGSPPVAGAEWSPTRGWVALKPGGDRKNKDHWLPVK